DDVVVSDSALTQCIKDVRKQLGDDAANPRYIETVPRYGYRFIGPVEAVPPAADLPEGAPVALPSGAAPYRTGAPAVDGGVSPPGRDGLYSLQAAALWGSAGALGGGFAGVLGGLLYGSALA